MHLRARHALIFELFAFLASLTAWAQQPDEAAIIRDIDAASQARFENVLGFTDVEHYAVYRGKDELHPAAEMTVRVTYKKGRGKTYQILSQSGSGLIHKFGLQPLLDNEKTINDPANVAKSWLTTANYQMRLKPGAPQAIDGRTCLAIAISPRHKASNLIEGTLWVDAHTHMQVQVEGVASKSPSIFAGTTKMMRRYVEMKGYAMATHARAESSSFFYGHTVLTIDYSDYELQVRSTR